MTEGKLEPLDGKLQHYGGHEKIAIESDIQSAVKLAIFEVNTLKFTGDDTTDKRNIHNILLKDFKDVLK